MKKIFISYKRADRDKVFAIKERIETATGLECWIDIEGIESDAQFMNVIIRAINNCEVVLFMYSNAHAKITDFESDWTIRELNFAKKKQKRIVFINIDGTPLSDVFEFSYSTKQQIDGRSEEVIERLCKDLSLWIGKPAAEAIPQPDEEEPTTSETEAPDNRQERGRWKDILKTVMIFATPLFVFLGVILYSMTIGIHSGTQSTDSAGGQDTGLTIGEGDSTPPAPLPPIEKTAKKPVELPVDLKSLLVGTHHLRSSLIRSNGGSLTINSDGSLYHGTGTIEASNGSLSIDGDFVIKNSDELVFYGKIKQSVNGTEYQHSGMAHFDTPSGNDGVWRFRKEDDPHFGSLTISKSQF